MRKIAVTMSKGGVGKTTTTVNLAHALVSLGKRVLVVDGDTQGQVAQFLGVKPKAGLFEFMTGELPQDQCVTVARPGLYVLAGGHNLLQLRGWLAQQTSTTIKEKLQPEPGKIDFLLYDTAPGLDVLAANILSAVDDLIVPVPLQGAVIHALSAFIDYYKSARRYNEKLQLKQLVPTLYDRRTSLHQSILRQLRKAYDELVADPIPYSIRMAEAVSFGKTIFEYDVTHMCALRYVALARRICDG